MRFRHYWPFVGGFPSQRASNAKHWCFISFRFLLSRTNCWTNGCVAGDFRPAALVDCLRRPDAHVDVTVMCASALVVRGPPCSNYVLTNPNNHIYIYIYMKNEYINALPSMIHDSRIPNTQHALSMFSFFYFLIIKPIFTRLSYNQPCLSLTRTHFLQL